MLNACAQQNDQSQTLPDLQRLANAVTEFSVSVELLLDEENLQQKSKIRASETTVTENGNIIRIETVDEEGTKINEYRYFNTDGTTPISRSEAFSLGEYQVVAQTTLTNEDKEFTLDFSANVVRNSSNGTVTGSLQLVGVGSTNYIEDDLLLSVDALNLGMNIPGDVLIEYELSFMQGEYEINLVIDSDFHTISAIAANPDSSKILAGADIVNSEGEKVGEFLLYEDDSVEILDDIGDTVEPND